MATMTAIIGGSVELRRDHATRRAPEAQASARRQGIRPSRDSQVGGSSRSKAESRRAQRGDNWRGSTHTDTFPRCSFPEPRSRSGLLAGCAPVHLAEKADTAASYRSAAPSVFAGERSNERKWPA